MAHVQQAIRRQMSAHMRPDSPGGLVEIDQRSREIFRHIVDGYLATGEPVGSRNIARLLPFVFGDARLADNAERVA